MSGDERTGRDVLLEVLRTEGVTHVFGNPGSTELPLIDALADAPDIHYVLGLQEATVVGMAEGYARATGRPAFVNLHTSAGLGNAIGNLTNARTNGVPLVVTAGQQDERHLAADPMLSGPLVDLARPTAPDAHEVRSLGELGTLLRRAFADAVKPPAGPTFLSLRVDLLDRTGPAAEIAAPPRSTIDLGAVAGRLDELAALLAGAAPGRVGLVAGEECAAPGVPAALAAVAETLGAPVHGTPLHCGAVFDPRHARWAGMLPPSAAGIRAALAGYDTVLFCGGQPFLVYPYSPGSPLPDGCTLLHLSPDPAWLGRSLPTRLGTAGALAPSLARLAELLAVEPGTTPDAADHDAAVARRAAEIERLEASARSRYGPVPADPMAAAHALVRAVPPGTAVVDEAITTGVYVRGFHHRGTEDGYHFCRGGGLGWGMPAAVGVSLGRDRGPVLCVVGDGASLYSPQALWTAARERLPVVFAVVDNGQYRILKDVLRGTGSPAARDERFVGLDLEPRVDHVALAASFGVRGTSVASTEDIGDVVRSALASGEPHLVHVPITAP